jgi:hypothetical protein
LTENVKLRFEGQFFNVFNHPNFALPNIVQARHSKKSFHAEWIWSAHVSGTDDAPSFDRDALIGALRKRSADAKRKEKFCDRFDALRICSDFVTGYLLPKPAANRRDILSSHHGDNSCS